MAAALMGIACSVHAADLYWDTDSSAPLVGSTSPLNLSGSHFSTSSVGDTALTSSTTNDTWYFQTDTVRAYTCNVDVAQMVESITVSNANNVMLSIDDTVKQLTVSNSITVAGGSSLTLKHVSNDRAIDPAPRTPFVLGSGDNTLKFEGSSGSAQFWLGGFFGDADDKVIFDVGGSWYRVDGTHVFGGELIGSVRLSPGTMTLTGDNPDLSGSLEGGTVILGDGGTNGAMGSARKTAAGTVRFNRSDDYVFTNEIAAAQNNQTINIANDGTGSVTVLSDLTVGNLFFSGDKGTVRGNVTVYARMWFSTPGTWTFAGTNNYAGGSTIYNALVRLSGAGAKLRIGDGSCYARATFSNNFSLVSGSALIMDITSGAQLTVISNLVAGAGRDLVIIGGGQEDPIITFSNSLTAFENVVYNGEVHTWAGAQVPRALDGNTQMRVESNAIYIDPLPPTGTVVVLW